MYVEDGNLRIVHSAAIMRHIARKVGLVAHSCFGCILISISQYGTNYEEAALCDMWMEQIEEVCCYPFPGVIHRTKVQRLVWNAAFLNEVRNMFGPKQNLNVLPEPFRV